MQKQNIGNAGEYYLAALLSAEDFTATITLGRAEHFDILALSPEGRSIKVSVKTRMSQETSAFVLNERVENYHDKDFYYAFIRLYEFKQEPEFWIIPSKVVAEVVKAAHQKWLLRLGKKNQKRNDSSVRRLPIILRGEDVLLYPEKWEDNLKECYKNLKQLH